VDDLTAQGVDALCLIAPRESSLDLLRRRDTGLPTLVIKSEPDLEMHTAAVDQYAGAMLAMNHLLDLGHRSIAHLAGPLDWFDARAREEAWREALTAAGLPADNLAIGDWTPDWGYEFGRNHDLRDTTAIFVANDQMALGVLHGLAERGLRVPEDISVVGFDDLPDSRHFLPPLTTVRQDFAALGTLALQSIVSAIDEAPTADHQMIEPRLIVRESTATPRG
jgi:DNA-binding LacI/PurR family transcriptional regulator